jgi:N-acetylglucosamine malate deacetylase 1
MSNGRDLSKTTAALVAHCDDFELGMGGTAAKLVAQGWEFYIFVLSSHRRRRSDKDADAADRLAQIREEEACCGAESLGIPRTNVHFLRISEDEDNRSVAGRIHRILESIFGTYRPSLPFLFTHSGHDRHADHVRCSLVASSAFRIPILKFAVASSTEADFRPDLCVDISDHFDRKIDAFAQHRTQAELKAGARPIIDVLREFDGRTRRETGFIFSECFEVSHLAAGAELDPVLQLCDSPAYRQRLTAKLASGEADRHGSSETRSKTSS